MTPLLLLVAALAAGEPAPPTPPAKPPAATVKNPRVVLETSKGKIVLELYADKAPKTVENFLTYVKAGFYDGTIFHRVIEGFMIQGGGMTAELREKQARDPIPNEAGNGLKNARGTIAMARKPDPGSATAQFFINTVENPFLDHKDETPRGFGYAVFGKVISGMDVVDAIARSPVATKQGYENVPVDPIVIKKATAE